MRLWREWRIVIVVPGQVWAFGASSPLRSCQARPPLLLSPVRPGVSTDDPAARAHHARSERRHRDVIRPHLDAQRRLVVTDCARHRERAHAVLADIAERHREDRFVAFGHGLDTDFFAEDRRRTDGAAGFLRVIIRSNRRRSPSSSNRPIMSSGICRALSSSSS